MSLVTYLTPDEQEAVRAQYRAGNAIMEEAVRARKPGGFYANRISAASRYAAEELIKCERFLGEICDASHTDNGIVEAFYQNGNACVQPGLDFLTYERGCTHVVTEPRPDLGEVYARKALTLITGKVALLLPVYWMTTPDAKKLFDETPLARVYILSKKLRYRGAMAWFVFEMGHFEGPTIRWI